MDMDADPGESLLQREIRKCQQAFAMSSNDEPEEFEDIQFFHRIPPVALTAFKIGDISRGFMGGDAGPSHHQNYGNSEEEEGEEGYQDSDSSYMFPQNVMEYGEPQFFPGNCVGYLETILEETDEDCEEEEGSSGRHWWTPDSDTDTESVIRIDPAAAHTASTDRQNPSTIPSLRSQKDGTNFPSTGLPSIGSLLTESTSSPSSPPFHASASSKPFEMENLYLFDQLDLAFEETLMKPRRRTGFAFEPELHLPILENRQLDAEKEVSDEILLEEVPEVANSCQSETADDQLTCQDEVNEDANAEDVEDDEQPAVVNEEDFFCSSQSCSEDENSLSETESSDDTTSTSSDEDKKSGIVLAEFSMQNYPNSNDGCGEMYKNSHAHPHRRSYEAPSKIRSFRSYDSLNSLIGTELLFSNPDTFPSVVQSTGKQFQDAGSILELEGSSTGETSRSSSTEDKVVASRKNSGEASSENLSEDSGIHDLLPCQQNTPEASPYQPKAEFALNPFIYSSASEDSSMLSYNYTGSTTGEVMENKSLDSDRGVVVNVNCGQVNNNEVGSTRPLLVLATQTTSESGYITEQVTPSTNIIEDGFNTIATTFHHYQYHHYTNNRQEPAGETTLVDVNRTEGLVMIESEPISTLGSSDDGACEWRGLTNPSPEVEQPTLVPMGSTRGDYYESELNSLLLLLPVPLAPGVRLPVPVAESRREVIEVRRSNSVPSSPTSTSNYETREYWPRQPSQQRSVDEFSQPYSPYKPYLTSHSFSQEQPIYQNVLPEVQKYNQDIEFPRVQQHNQHIEVTEVRQYNQHIEFPEVQQSNQHIEVSEAPYKQYIEHPEEQYKQYIEHSEVAGKILSECQHPPAEEANFGLLPATELLLPAVPEPVEPRTSEEPDYVTLVRNEEDGGRSCVVHVLPSPVEVYPLAREDVIYDAVNSWPKVDPIVPSGVSTNPFLEQQLAPNLEQEQQLPPLVGQKLTSIAEEDIDIMQVEPARASSPSVSSVPIPIKTYGGARNNDVAVYLVPSGSSRTPSPTVPNPSTTVNDPETGSATGSLTKTKTVHFSPVVSEISWRESYAEPCPEDNDPESPYYNPNGQEHHDDPDGNHGDIEPIEKVQVHSQVLSEPLPMVIPKTEKERLMALEPTADEPPRMSSVPDLVSQCVPNTAQHQQQQQSLQHHDEVDASPPLELNGDQGRPYYFQQQIFPAMFVATPKEAAEVNQVHFKKNGKKATYVAPPTIPPNGTASTPAPLPPKSTTKATSGKRGAEKDESVAKETKSKPGFFQRLSKIRLSGSNKNKQPKAKVFPKEIEPLNGSNNPKGEVAVGPTILKKGPPSPLVLQDHLTPSPPDSSSINHNGTKAAPQAKDHDECSEAFENILEEIAGLNTILQRQQFPAGSGQLNSSSGGSSGGKRLFAERKQFLINPETQAADKSSTTLDSKLSQFKEEASRTRDQISRSHPDLETIEELTSRRQQQQGGGSSPGGLDDVTMKIKPDSPGRGRTETKTNEREWYRLLRSAAEKYYHGGRKADDPVGQSTGIVETDLDTGTSRELLDAELVILDDLAMSPPLPTSLPPSGGGGGAKAQSLTNLTSGRALKLSIAPDHTSDGTDPEAEERAKSLEFLLDEKQKSAASPPENKLQQDNRHLSEHELRVERSLQRINVPEWYRRHSYRSKSAERDRSELKKDTPLVSSTGTTALQLLKRNDYGSSSGLAGGWAGLSAYRTPSLSSLGNGGLTTGSLNRSNFVRGRPATMSATRSSKESLLSPSSTASQSPSAFERSSFTYGMPLTMTRFGKGRLSSTSGTSPASGSSPSTPGQTSSLSVYVKQPYLGWRSQEKLQTVGTAAATTSSSGLRLSTYRPPAERLAADMLTRQKKTPTRPTGSDRPPLPKWPSRTGSDKAKTMSLPPQPVSEEILLSHDFPRTASPSIHDSIKEVTDAISEFVTNGHEGPPKPQPRTKNVKKQALWFESSFVGKKTQTQ